VDIVLPLKLVSLSVYVTEPASLPLLEAPLQLTFRDRFWTVNDSSSVSGMCW
jgi:hypothetical protein